MLQIARQKLHRFAAPVFDGDGVRPDKTLIVRIGLVVQIGRLHRDMDGTGFAFILENRAQTWFAAAGILKFLHGPIIDPVGPPVQAGQARRVNAVPRSRLS